MTREEFDIEIAKIEKEVSDKGVYADVYQYADLPVVCVEINWGDWKHDHLRADWILEELGWNLFKTEITDEDGSDCYSAIRYYVKAS